MLMTMERAYKRAEGRLLLPRLPRRHRQDSRRIPDEHQRAVPTGGTKMAALGFATAVLGTLIALVGFIALT